MQFVWNKLLRLRYQRVRKASIRGIRYVVDVCDYYDSSHYVDVQCLVLVDEKGEEALAASVR